jgi:hypothetical protein
MQAPMAIVINNSMAGRYWPGQDAVGKRITFSDHPAEKDWFHVVGVVGDVKDLPSSAAAEPAFWWSQDQQGFDDMLVAIRAVGNPVLLLSVLRTEVMQIDPELPVTNARTMKQVVGASRSTSRLVLLLTGVFSALALGLAAIGTYGVIAYSVAQRVHEIGLRIALGARRWDVLRLVGGQGLRLALAGIVIGLLGSLALGRLLDRLLFGVKAYDPLTLLTAFGGALVVALLAGYVPARRATRVDPMISLRSE